ncbi:site-specific integrase [Synechococcus sp. UW105]|uniref:site-specific integrase n=1 Tax=Synechococcus sp. UW105 TaxID=337067 RepID=UPI000E0ECF2E|nr:site-specific integrase [Synechococcus sp. UW105]
MPAIKSSITVEQGISVFSYQTGKEGWYVRKWVKHERRYRIKKIDGATTQEEALANFYKALVSFEQKPQRVNAKKLKHITIGELVLEFTKWEAQRVSAGLKNERAHERRRISLKWMLAYLAVKHIEYPDQIDPTTWEDYPVFRMDVRKNTRKSELKDIGVFCRHFLVPRGYLSNEIAMGRLFIPRVSVNEEDLDANPAITPHDYRVINNHLRNHFVTGKNNKKGEYTRRMFYGLVHILKNSGCRPSELLAVRRKDIEITNPKRWSETLKDWVDDYKLKIHIRKSKTGKKRDVLCRSNAAEHLLEFMKYQRSYFDAYYPRLITYPETLLFGNPAQLLERPYVYRYLDSLWEEVRGAVKSKLDGNRFSERNYTLYSLRSTFIEDCITDGLDVYLVARLCGNSVDVIQKHYDRHDVLNRAEEVQAIPVGRKKRPRVEVIEIADI